MVFYYYPFTLKDSLWVIGILIGIAIYTYFKK